MGWDHDLSSGPGPPLLEMDVDHVTTPVHHWTNKIAEVQENRLKCLCTDLLIQNYCN